MFSPFLPIILHSFILFLQYPSPISLHLRGTKNLFRYDGLLIGKPHLLVPRDQELHAMHAYMGLVDAAQAKTR